MNEASFASLNSGLLARKGGAKPAMRPQMTPLNPQSATNLEDLGWNDMGDGDEPRKADVLPLTPEPANPETASQAKANDAEADAQLHDIVAEKPVVRRQLEEIAERIETPSVTATKPVKEVAATVQPAIADEPAEVAVPARPRKSAIARGKRAAFTLRLDEERHLKLRLATTIRGRSAQQIVTEALDRLLRDLPELDTLAAQVKRR